MPVAVHVVAGFLGTGKTTVLQHLMLGLSRERVGVVVNDFGEAAIDREVLGGDRSVVREIQGSCVCCTAPEGFVAALGELLARGALDRILVEPTGLARPSDVIDTLRRAPFASELELGPLVVVVDPGRLVRGELSDEVLAQASVADVLVANRTDTASELELELFRSWVASLWPGPHAVHETVRGRVPRSVLAWPDRPPAPPSPGPGAGHAPGAPAADAHTHTHTHAHTHAHAHGGADAGGGAHEHGADAHGFAVDTFRWSSDAIFHRGRLLDVIRAIGAERLKGIFRTDEGTVLLQVASGSLSEVSSDRRGESRIDVIVSAPGAQEILKAAREALDDALLQESERIGRSQTLEIALPNGRVRPFDRASLAALPGQIPDVSTLIPSRKGAAARLCQILDAAGVPVLGDAVVVASDGYITPPVSLGELRSAVLLHSLDDKPLPADRGGPFRLLIPGAAAPAGPCSNVKAVVRIAVRSPGSLASSGL
ncbi:MAG TPA: hypothetical protein ENK18_00700 [Deltaproteobacteria bacterium]|nr:hypothetical protein [Deltaproteobacteria bacterium]